MGKAKPVVKKHGCQNQCGEGCDCSNTIEQCVFCTQCTENVPNLSQCDYCTNRATLECEGCHDLFWCMKHEDAQSGKCDTCRDTDEDEDEDEDEDN